MNDASARTYFAPQESHVSIGERLRQLRQGADLTLSIIAQRSGISASTLSKIENDKVSPTFANLLKIAGAFGVPLSRLIGDDKETSAPTTGRFAVTRARDIAFVRTPNYDMGALCADLRNKRMSPFLDNVRGSATNIGDRLVRHAGEEFVYVLKGELEIHTEHYAPIRLEPGDSAYFDSSMAHAFRSAGEAPAQMLMVWLPPEGGSTEHREQLMRYITLVDGGIEGNINDVSEASDAGTDPD